MDIQRVAQPGYRTGRQYTTVYDHWSECFQITKGEIIVSKRTFCLWGIGGLVALGALAWSATARAGYESAPYEVIESDGNIEIREYPDLVLASTEARFEARGNDGSFMRLFRYISGNNKSDQKIEMTTPVFMEPESQDQKGKMGFVIPQAVVDAGPPSPNSSDVSIRNRVGGRFAVIRFSGIMNAKKAETHESQLRQWLSARGLEGEQTAERAGYDPPFTPGPLRRNEVLVRLKTDH
ncbi:MAG: heme-binding protein [Planctomycetaceae bacterium]|nr:heme-binding protein [Planctomycetaceae bacterium]